MEIDFFAIVFVVMVILTPCILIYAIGMFVQRKIAEKNPNHSGVIKLRGVEIAWMSLLVICMLVGMAAVKLAPESMIGSFLISWFGTWYGWVAVPVVLYIVGFVGALIGILLGVVKNTDQGDV